MKKTLINKIGIALVLSFILFGVIISIIRGIKLENSHMYTIGQLYKIGGGGRSSPSLYYKYNINNKLFNVIHSQVTKNKIFSSKAEIGKRYYVKFEKDNPKNSEMLTDYPVPDSIKEAPVNGWDTLPRSSDAVRGIFR